MFGNKEKYDPNTDIPDLSGKTYIVLGGSAGIGFGICAHLLQHNCEALYLLGRSEDHLKEAEEGFKKYGDVSRVHPVQIDLQDLKQTDQVSRDLASKLDKVDGLICNAGLGVGPFELSKDGIDTHMQVNFIAQFHVIMVLLPVLQRTPNSRLVLQSSEFHRFVGDVEYASLEELNTDVGANKLYSRTKLAMVVFIRALAERKSRGELGFDKDPTKGPWINASHPGAVVTDQQEQMEQAWGTKGKVAVKVIRPFMKEPIDEGCRPALFAATGEDIVNDHIQGQYIVPDRKVSDVTKQAKDEKLSVNLWKLTEQLLSEKIGKLPYPTYYL